jgi:amidase
MNDLIRMTAREVLGRLNAGDVSHAEVLDALAARVAAVDGAVNALPTLCFERARRHAAEIAAKPVAERGVLGGLPVPIKDLEKVAGVRSTDGSPIHADRVPQASDYIVERIEAAGGVVYAKSNTPEFGAGASTFNEVFGRTHNPWNLSRSVAGSSGGAAAARRFEAMGAIVEEAHPDFSGAHEAFQTLRAVSFATSLAVEYAEHRGKLKPDVAWNIEKGFKISGAEVARANRYRAGLVSNVTTFFETYDLLLAPATIVPPFPVGDRTVTECDGQAFETYIDWLAIVYAVTLTSAPALSLPCGFTADGLPVGLQMVGPLRAEGPLLSHAAALEGALGLDLGPIDPRDGR